MRKTNNYSFYKWKNEDEIDYKNTWIERSLLMWSVNKRSEIIIVWHSKYFDEYMDNFTSNFSMSLIKDFWEEIFWIWKTKEEQKESLFNIYKNDENTVLNEKTILWLIIKWVFEEFQWEDWLIEWKDFKTFLETWYLFKKYITKSITKDDKIPFYNLEILMWNKLWVYDLSTLEYSKLYYKHCL